MNTRATIVAITGLALIAGLTGCTGDPVTHESAGGGSPASETELSPLDEYLAAAYDSGLTLEEQEKKEAELWAKFGEVVAQCMRDEGFEYYLEEPEIPTADVEIDWRPNDRDWVKKYGYGVVDSPDVEGDAVETSEPDPNFTYRDSLPESAQTAYDLALSGPDNPVDENGEPILDYDWQQAGCNGFADHEVYGAGEPDPYADLLVRIDEMKRGWETGRPEMAELNAEWSACMSEADEPGFGIPFDARLSISDAVPDGKSDSGEAPTEEETAAAESAWMNSQEREALLEREIELALTDLDCREKTEYADKSKELQYAAERKFIEDNKAELDAFKLAAEQADG